MTGRPSGSGEAPRGGARRRRLVRAWTIGLAPVLLLLVVVVLPAARQRLHRSADPSLAAGPVLLVAGYGGSTASLQVLAARLRADGRQVLIVPTVGDNTGDLREQARALDRVARQQIAGGAPSVDLVGYSAGGVTARIWAAELGGAALARRVVTLGSPHHGTDAAQLAAGLLATGCPTACRQLASSGELLRGLPEAPTGPRWISVWSRDDELVLPPESARLSGAVDVELQRVCADARVSHGALPTDPLPIGVVLRALDDAGLAAVPAAGECAALRAEGGSPVNS